MVEFSSLDQLLEALKDPGRYPLGHTLLTKSIPAELRRSCHKRLFDCEDDIFDSSRKRIVFWETTTKDQDSWTISEVTTHQALAEHLLQQDGDPKCRHIFIESQNSRAPINCSMVMFQMLLTFHQIGPCFLECIFTFGDSDDPVDASLSQFLSDDTLGPQTRLPAIPSLGRSGKQIRHCLLLRSIEHAPEAPSEPWSIRQVAAYSSFDVDTGHAVFMTVKGNDSLQRRIMEDTVYQPTGALRGQPAKVGILASFEAFLETLLIYLSWCERDIRWYVRDREDSVREALLNIMMMPVDRSVNAVPTASRANTSISTSMSNEKHGLFGSLRARAAGTPARPSEVDVELANVTQPAKQEPSQQRSLERPNYKEYMILVGLGDKLKEAALVIRLDRHVLQDVIGKHEALLLSSDIDEELLKTMRKPIYRFLSEVHALDRRLEIRETQLISLQAKLAEGKPLYENLLQYRSLQVTQMFAELGTQSSVTMQSIAYKTERETVSIHVIAIVTLLFLPATFLSSFFQSGVLQWQDTQDFMGQWFFRTEVFQLFVVICIPMTITTLLVWLFVSYWGRLQFSRKLAADAVEVAFRPLPV
ncbi:hypothetical protein QBC44DRAFT_94719 [Cladorrhinum sp. PSN332]|nr:hypothetical protein QBC44DRAFT_94719 [Cladorrhinum sp. PSN332]